MILILLGVIFSEIITGTHPLENYPIAFTQNGVLKYSPSDISKIDEDFLGPQYFVKFTIPAHNNIGFLHL